MPDHPADDRPGAGSDPGYVTTIFDAAGRTLSSTDQIGDTTSYTYDPGGQTLTTTDPRGKVTTDCYYYQNGTGQCAHGAPADGGSADDLYSTTTPTPPPTRPARSPPTPTIPATSADTTTTPAGTTTDTYDANGDLTAVAYSGTAFGVYHPGQPVLHLQRGRHPPHHGRRHRHHHLQLRRQRRRHLPGADRQRTGLANTTTVLQLLHHRRARHGHLPRLHRPHQPGGHLHLRRHRGHGLGDGLAGRQVTFAHDSDGNTTGQDNNVSSTNPNGTSRTAFSYDNADQTPGHLTPHLPVWAPKP